MSRSPDRQSGHNSEARLLEFRQVSKLYGQQVALADVSLSVERERFVVLLGPSGSGKTSLLRCAAGTEHISEGAVYLDGELVDDGRRPVPPERRQLAMVFQDYALWPHMRARENVAYPLRRRRVSSSVADRRAREMLARVGLGALTERYPSELSGGEQQRVALARALVARPRLLLFDEPLSNLDPSLRDRMRVEIGTLVRDARATALYITHDQTEAFGLADQVGVLDKGRLVQFGTPEAIYATPATAFVARLTGLSGELPGDVARVGADGVVTVRVFGRELAVPTRDAPSPGSSVMVMVRPSAVELLPPTRPDCLFRAEVLDAAFCGRGYEHVVQLVNGHQLSSVFAEHRWERGSHVGVRLAERGCLVFARGPAADGVIQGVADTDSLKTGRLKRALAD